MKLFFLITNWLFGLIFLLLGVLSIIDLSLGSIALFIIASLLLPPIRNFIYKKTNKELSTELRSIIIFILFALFGILAQISENKKINELKKSTSKEKIEKIKKLRNERIIYFQSHRLEIINKLKNNLLKKKYENVISLSKLYLISSDQELENIYNEAKKQFQEIEKKRITKETIQKLKKLPSAKYKQNKEYYKILVDMHPDNQQYKSKLKYYTKLLNQKEKKEKLALEKANKIKKQFNNWDGSHNKLELYIKNRMNDPDSYKHVRTTYSEKDNFLIVKTTFRGKNTFGGVVLNTIIATVDLNGNILKIIKNN